MQASLVVDWNCSLLLNKIGKDCCFNNFFHLLKSEGDTSKCSFVSLDYLLVNRAY